MFFEGSKCFPGLEFSTENFSTSQRKSRRNLFLKSSVIQIRVACKTFRRRKEKQTWEGKKKREREIKLPFLGAPKFMRHTCLQLKVKISA